MLEDVPAVTRVSISTAPAAAVDRTAGGLPEAEAGAEARGGGVEVESEGGTGGCWKWLLQASLGQFQFHQFHQHLYKQHQRQ